MPLINRMVSLFSSASTSLSPPARAVMVTRDILEQCKFTEKVIADKLAGFLLAVVDFVDDIDLPRFDGVEVFANIAFAKNRAVPAWQQACHGKSYWDIFCRRKTAESAISCMPTSGSGPSSIETQPAKPTSRRMLKMRS